MPRLHHFRRPLRAAVIAAVAWIFSGSVQGYGGETALPLPRSTDFTLSDVRGGTVTATDFRGQSMLVYFGYTRCPDVCPLALGNTSAALDLLDDAAGGIQIIFISVDAENDTPGTVAAFIGRFRGGVVGLSGDKQAVFKAARNYGVRYRSGRGKAAEVSHLDYVFLVGPDGLPRDVFSGALAPEQMAARIRSAAEAGGLQTMDTRHRDAAGSAKQR